MNKHSLFARLTTLAMTSVAAVALTAGGASAQEAFKMGGIASLTGAGATVGAVSEAAWKLAVETINEEGGILGKPVQLFMADTLTDPTHGVSEARRLIENEGIEMLVGPVTSQETIPIVDVTTAANIAQFSTAASSVLTPEVGPYHFSTSVTAANQTIPAIDYAIKTLGLTKLGIISDNGGMSKAGVAEIIEYLEKQGLEPSSVQEFAFRTEDMTPQLLSMRRSGAEGVIFVASIGDDARKFLENREDIGWEAPVLANQTMTNFGTSNAAILGAEAFNNVFSTQFVGMTYCPGDAVGESPFAKFVTKANASVENVDKMGGAQALTPFYIEPMIGAAAINASGTTKGSEIAAWMEANSDKIPTIIGPISVSATNHFMPAPSSIKVVNNPHMVREDGLFERIGCDS